MGMPEFVVQEGIRRAWSFLKDRTFVLGHLMRELPVDKQERYRTMIESEEVSFLFQNATTKSPLPAFSVLLLSESEEGQYIGDAGLDDRDLLNSDIDVFPQDEFYGVTYPDEEEPQLLGVDGVRGLGDPNHPLPRKNLNTQNADGDEQREQMGNVQRLWHRSAQRLSTSAIPDMVSIGIVVTTDNAEKTFIYYRLLRWVLRRFSTWFHVNGLQNATFSGSDLAVDEMLMPTTSGPTVFKRQLTMTFMFEDRYFEVDKVLLGWMLELEMVTVRPDGELDTVPLVHFYPKKDPE